MAAEAAPPANPETAPPGPEAPEPASLNTASLNTGSLNTGDLEDLPARTLDKTELRELVDSLAERPELWRTHVAFSDGRRHYASLYRDEYVDVWLLCWTPSNDTGWHDHDISAGAVRVVAGALEESNPRIGGEHVEIVVPEGTSFCFGPDHIHRLAGAAAASVSIHAYSPPLWRLGQYTIAEDGLMRRTSVSYADELRPLT